MLTRGVNLKSAFDTLTLWRNPTNPDLSIACRLPVELLQVIFLLLAEHHAPDRDYHPSQSHHPWRSSSPSSRPDWIDITHVCRHWRLAALGLRELWSAISPGLSISWAQAMMERSSPLPVHVDIRISSGNTNTSSSPSSTATDGLHPLAASELLFVASRIRTLRLAGLRADILHILNRLRSPSSQLKSLTLSIYDSGGPAVSLPITLFGGNDKAPNLRHLTFVTDTCIRAPHWLLGGITEFTTGADVALPELLETLRVMPQLQILRVQHCRAAWDEDAAPTGTEGPPLRSVTLPHLQLISFRDTTPRRFVLLILRILAPSTVRRHLFWRSWAVANWERWSGMLISMRPFIPRNSVVDAQDGGLRAARVRGGPAQGSFCAWSRSSSASGEAGKEDALFLFQIDWMGSPIDPRAETLREHSSPFFHLGGLCTQLPEMHVTNLTIEPEPELDREQSGNDASGTGIVSTPTVHWQSLLRALGSVQSLRLHGGNWHGGIVIVMSASDSDGLLPHLQKLYIVQCDIKSTAEPAPTDGIVLWNLKRFALRGDSALGRAGPVRHDGAAGRGASAKNELVALVRRRVGLGVILVGCDVDDEALDELRNHAQVSIGDERVCV